MMKLQINKGLLLLLCFSISTLVRAQQFSYECRIKSVKQTGFYSIPVVPDLSEHIKLDFSDVRIWDKKENQVPYIIRNSKPRWQMGLFQPFIITDNELDDSGRSNIIIHKNISNSIASLSLIIGNASVSRYASLSGSNDGKSWFIISEGILVNDSYQTLSDSSIQSIFFPVSSYAYFKLVINNQKSDPLNILSIGHYPKLEYSSGKASFVNSQMMPVVQNDSNGISYVKIIQRADLPVNSLSMHIAGPRYFARRFSLSVPARDKKGRNYQDELIAFTVSSVNSYETVVPAFKSKEFYLTIDNGDNPPLKIESVTTYQDYHEIVAWLEAGKEYKLVMDAAGATAPHYDLQQFADSISTTLPEAVIEQIQPRTASEITDKSEGFPQKYIWLIMAGVLALLSLLTWRLTAEIRKPDKQ